MKIHIFIAFVIINVLLITHSIHGDDVYTSYLFAYFTGNSGNEEAIRFAISNDGHTFKALNNYAPILASAEISEKGGVRDPHILRGENNDYYMVATDMVAQQGWDSNRGIVLLKSNNLVDWKHSTVNVQNTFPQYSTVDRVWAPQTIYDSVEKKYMLYFAMRLGSNDKDKIYYAYADSSFTKLETAPKLLYKYGDLSAIDADIIYKDSLYYLFFKTEGSGNGIKSATSKTLTQGYLLNAKYLQVTSNEVEGSCVFKLNNSDKYILMYDVYKKGFYEYAISTDLKNFTKDPTPVYFDFTPRHGTVIPITSEEKNRLNAKWNPIGVISNQVFNCPVVSCSTTGSTLQIMFRDEPINGLVYLFDLTGKIVFHKAAIDKTIIIQFKTLPAGVYNVRCKTVTGITLCTKIIVQH